MELLVAQRYRKRHILTMEAKMFVTRKNYERVLVLAQVTNEELLATRQRTQRLHGRLQVLEANADTGCVRCDNEEPAGQRAFSGVSPGQSVGTADHHLSRPHPFKIVCSCGASWPSCDSEDLARRVGIHMEAVTAAWLL